MPGTHCMGGLAGLIAGKNTRLEERSCASAGDQTLVIQSAGKHLNDT
jgi:hypothetical protein